MTSKTTGNNVVDGENTSESMVLGYDDANAPTNGGGDRITNGNDTIEGNGGNDTIDGAGGDDVVRGGTGDDVLAGSAGNNFLAGGTGDDLFIGGEGADTFEGGAGQDNIDYSASDAGVRVNLSANTFAGGDAANDTNAGGIDGVIGSDFADVLVGFDQQQTSGSDVFTNEFSGRGGDDTIQGLGGDDKLFGGADDDRIEGGAGADLIYGDSDLPGDAVGRTVREKFEWDEAGQSDQGDLGSFSQNTGSVQVDFRVVQESAAVTSIFEADQQNIAGIQGDGTPVDANSSFESVLNGNGNTGRYAWDFDADVTNVSFRINDLDGDGVVKVTAFDTAGNEVVIDLQAGNLVTLSDTGGAAGADTAESEGGYLDDTAPQYSILVTIPGPVSQINLLHSQDGHDNSGINVTDIYFDAPLAAPGVAGNDDLLGGEGDDTIYGEDGDDTLTGGTGADSLFGGADRDLLNAGAGDVVDGGAGGFNANDALNTDFDVLDLTGQGAFILQGVVADGNGNGFNGTVVFVDGSGAPTGDTLAFTEIEKIVGDQFNQAPDAQDDVASTDEDTPVLIDVLANDSDPEGDALTITTADSPNGDVAIVGGQLEFTPDPDFNGTTTITYTITDGDKTDTATVTVNVAPVNDAPVAVDDVAATDEDTPVLIDVLANDSDPDGDALTISAADSPNGDVAIVGGQLEFTPDPDFNGTTTITYTITDGDKTDTATVTVNVAPVNDAPVAVDDVAATDEDTPVLIDVLANDSDPDGDALTISAADSPNGDVAIVGGQLEFTPDPDFTGDTTITYTITDGDKTDTATVTVSVAEVNDAPVAVDDTAMTDEDTPVLIDVLANDSDPDGDALTITAANSPNGDVAIVGGQLEFTPDPDFNGDTTITYTISDGDKTDTATVTVNVAPVNDAPVAVDDVASTDEDTSVLIDVLANDSDPEGDALTITAADSPNGDVAIVDGQLEFTPDPDFTGDTTITYTISDGEKTDTATVTVSVADVNDAPVAVDDDVEGGRAGLEIVVDVLDNDSDPDGDPIKVIGATSDDGTVTFNDTSITFTPNNGFEGEATVTYTIQDVPGGLTDTATVTIDTRNGIVNGTDDGELIDVNFEGDPGGDKVDNMDAFLPGEDPNDDIIQAGGGNDTIISGEGNDGVFGGDGDDDINTSNGDVAPDIGYPFAPDPILGFDPDSDPNNDRDFVDGGDGNDTITTGDDRDFILGGDGEDKIDGGVDDDTINGGDDDDRIVGGEGNDDIVGGDGNDTIFAGNDPLGVGDLLDLKDDEDNDLGIVTVGPDQVPFNGKDSVDGGAGNDLIFGADDDDVLFGGTGNDTLHGEIDDDILQGGEGRDSLLGGQGNDSLIGGDGADVIDGGIGNDDLFGGEGQDVFVNLNAGDTVDGGEGTFLADGDPDNTDFDTLDLRGSAPEGGSLRVIEEGPDRNGNGIDGRVEYFDENGELVGEIKFTEIEEVIPCFTPGTLIATPKGERPVEELEVGDRVITRDNGIQQIRWIGAKTLSGQDVQDKAHLRPVLIRQGALGKGLPERDMLVSPNHRVLISNDKTSLFFDESEVLVAAKHLVGMDGVDVVDVSGVTYLHVMFDQHEVILSDGAWTESFQPGDMSLAGVGAAQRSEIFELFPELQTEDGIEAYTAARRSLKKHEARLLAN